MKERTIRSLVDDAVAFATAHGLSMTDATDATRFTHAPMTLLPALYPPSALQKAQQVAELYNTMVDRIARNEEWLRETLANVLDGDSFTRELVKICEETKARGVSQKWYLGLNRSDYMLNTLNSEKFQLLQVELNTISSSFGALSTRVTSMHRYILSTAFRQHKEELCAYYNIDPATTTLEGLLAASPDNAALENLSAALAAALKCYNESTGANVDTVLFVVQAGERNVFDQRALEYELFKKHGVYVLRKTLQQVAEATGSGPSLCIDGREIGVVYFRAGYTPNDYPSQVQWAGRRKIEFSTAIKCPSISYHLAGTKKVQQQLAKEGELEKFVSKVEADELRSTFAGLWSLDSSEQSAQDKTVVENAKRDPSGFVMKPQREGGGNNFYGQEITQALEAMSEAEVSSYILMQRIFPSEYNAILLRESKLQRSSAISEVGLFAAYLGNGKETRLNKAAGHLMRTKALGVDEGGVASGYSYLDSPLLYAP